MIQENTSDIKHYFINSLDKEDFVMDRSGQKTIELIGASFFADQPAIFGTPNESYIEIEKAWYESQSTNVNWIPETYNRNVPEAWQASANQFGQINSNYGHLIYSGKYYKQYDKVLKELLTNPDSRRGSMIYQRPSIWKEYKENGKNDFICTNAVTYYIRDNMLHATVQMRSNDVVFGYKNDYAWQKVVQERLLEDLYYNGIQLELGYLYWQVQNLHVYERHFDLVK